MSILAVIWFHTGLPVPGSDLLHQGALGVDQFFAISGFLITTLLLREREQAGTISLRAFYARRSLRIFPLYYAVILVYVAAVLLFERNSGPGQAFLDNLPYFLTYTSNWFVALEGRVIFYFAWSLATEEQFYLVWPLIVLFLPGWGAAWLAVAVTVARTGLAFLVSQGVVDGGLLATRIVLSVHPAILGGAVLAYVLHDRRTFCSVWLVLGHQRTAPLMLGVLLAALVLMWPIEAIWILMIVLVGSVVVREDHGLGQVLRWRPIAHVGVVSYGMYLMHMLCYNAVRKALGDAGLAYPEICFPLTALLVLTVATASYRYFERPFLALRKRFARARTGAH